jgi:hypothetical protein
MAAGAGGISIPINIDAGDIGTQISHAVEQAMTDANKLVRQGISTMEAAFGRIDMSGLDRITAATRNLTASLNQIDVSNLRQASAEAGRLSTAIDNVNAAEIRALVTQVGQLQIALRDARQETGRLDNETEQAARRMRQAGEEGEHAGKQIGSAFNSAGESLAAVGAGLVSVAGLTAAFSEAVEHANISNKLRAQLDLTKDQSEEAGHIAGSLYSQAYGENLEDVTDAVGDVVAGLQRLGTEGAETIEGLTKNAIDFNAVFGVETAESVQTVAQLIQNQLVNNATEGFDLLFASFQRVPTAMREEIPELINEYGTFFKSIGLDGPEAFGVLVGASAQGALAMDKMGDAIKEVGIRATDIGDTGAVEALKEIGLEGEHIQERLLQGGDAAKAAFHQMTTALLEMPDATKQAAAAVALFGTPIEDLDKTQIAGFLEAMSHAGEAMTGFEGAASRAGEAINASPNAALITFKRNLEELIVGKAGQAIQWMNNNADAAKALGIALTTVVAAYVALRIAGAIGAVIEGVRLAMAGTAIAANASALATGGYTATLVIQKAALLATAAASGIATAATWALNAAIVVLTSPITLIIAAIALVVGALVLFFTKTEIGKRIFAELKDAVLIAWEAIKNAAMAAWAFLQPIFQAIWSFITDTLAPAFMSLWNNAIKPAFEGIGAIISWWWNSIVMPVFSAVIGFIVGSLWPAIQTLWADVKQAWDSWAALFNWWWTSIVQPIFGFVVDIIRNIVAPAITWLWNEMVRPAFEGIGQIISFTWDSVIKPVFDFIKGAIDLLGTGFSIWWNDIVKPIWSGLGDLITSVWENFIRPAWDAMKTALSGVGDFFGSIVDGIAGVWNKLKGILAVPINFMIGTVYNNGIRKAWNAIEKFIPGLDAAPEIGLIPEAWTGGRIAGPKGKDNVLMWGSDGEHMLTVDDVTKAGGHDVVYAIRDMIQRGVPFTWNGGQVIDTIGRGNIERYGAAVRMSGLGNVNPEGLFDKLLPQFYQGGAIEDEPWMKQLALGHEFAMAQSGKPYQWAGPTGAGSSFDCSGFMGSIAAAITGQNPWQRYWATASFAGYPNVGPMGFTKGTDAGFSIGVTDDPGGPGGGHTAGVLGAAGRFIVARVESGGSLGDVHYGTGTDIGSFAAQYHLPIGANGFFEAGSGTGGSGPSTESMMDFLRTRVKDTFNVILDPIKKSIVGIIGASPPMWHDIPPKFLDHGRDVVVDRAFNVVENLGGLVSQAWSKATSVGKDVLDFVNPFDAGGLASGTGIMPKNVIAPERVLSPEQTRLFEALVSSLQMIAGTRTAEAPSLLTANVFQQGIDFLASAFVLTTKQSQDNADSELVPADQPQTAAIQLVVDEVGKLATTMQEISLRSESSQELVVAQQAEQTRASLDNISQMLTDQALIPIMQSAVTEGIGVLRKWLDAGADQVTKGTDRTTAAVQAAGSGDSGAAAPFGAPGSSFDATAAISQAVVGVANTAGQAFTQVANSIAQAALAQTTSKVDQSKGVLGKDISGGQVVDTIVRLTGVEIQIRDTLINSLEQITAFRGDLKGKFDESGRIITDTAELMQRNESSRELVISETERINRELIKAVLKYLVLNVLLPIIQAILGAMITLATTAIGAAIGSFIPIIGTAIGAAIGAVIGAALAGLAAVFTSALAVGAGAAINAFDEGGIATGIGFLPKNTLAPERVLSPRQTNSFDRLVNLLDRTENARNVTINAPFTVVGGQNAGQQAHNDLLSLLNS